MSDIPPPPPPPQPSFPQPAPPPGSGAYQVPNDSAPAFGGPSFQPTVQPARSGKAVAALVLGLVGLLACFVIIPSLLALVFGVLALRAIGRSGGHLTGKGLAIAGTVLGAVGVVAGAVLIVLAVNEFSGTTSVQDLEVGQCVELPDDGEEISRIDTFDCTEPHGAQVIAVADIGEGDEEYPGDEAIGERVFEDCVEAFEDYVGLSYFDSEFQIFPITPVEDNWDNDQTYICLAFDPKDDLTESIEGANR